MADVQYKRLTRARLRSTFAVAVTSRSSLWLGPDHLLVIDTSGYTETYKRFYFRDIQSFTVALSKQRLAWNWALGALTAVSLACWGLYFSSNAPGLTSATLAVGTVALFAVPLLINNLLGPSCTCHLRTAVQTELLCPLNRLRRAHTIMDRLRPLIIEAQGSAGFPPVAAAAAPEAVSGSTLPMEGAAPVSEPDDVPPRMAS